MYNIIVTSPKTTYINLQQKHKQLLSVYKKNKEGHKTVDTLSVCRFFHYLCGKWQTIDAP